MIHTNRPLAEEIGWKLERLRQIFEQAWCTSFDGFSVLGPRTLVFHAHPFGKGYAADVRLPFPVPGEACFQIAKTWLKSPDLYAGLEPNFTGNKRRGWSVAASRTNDALIVTPIWLLWEIRP